MRMLIKEAMPHFKTSLLNSNMVSNLNKASKLAPLVKNIVVRKTPYVNLNYENEAIVSLRNGVEHRNAKKIPNECKHFHCCKFKERID